MILLLSRYLATFPMQIDNLINDRRITKYLIGTIIIQNILELSKL